MNSRCFFTPGSISACNFPTGEGRIESNLGIRVSRNSPPTFLIRLAMKVSRAKWYSFMRRVFHYQNGSGSDLGPNPFNSRNWILMESIALAIQIVDVAYTLMVSKGERPIWPMRIWVSGYAFVCLISLLILWWRYRIICSIRGDGSSVNDLEQQRNTEESRNSLYMNKCRSSVELLFALWFVMGNVWIFGSRIGSYNGAPKLHFLCISLLALNAVSYSFPFVLFVLLCCCVPLLSRLLGYNMNMASLDRGATDEQLACLPCWKYKDVGTSLEIGKSGKKNEIQECCICLAKYKDKEEIRELPCAHIFHLKCVDQWLKIIPCCPLCKQEIEK